MTWLKQCERDVKKTKHISQFSRKIIQTKCFVSRDSSAALHLTNRVKVVRFLLFFDLSEEFDAVGQFYKEFLHVEDDVVIDILRKHIKSAS